MLSMHALVSLQIVVVICVSDEHAERNVGLFIEILDVVLLA